MFSEFALHCTSPPPDFFSLAIWKFYIIIIIIIIRYCDVIRVYKSGRGGGDGVGMCSRFYCIHMYAEMFKKTGNALYTHACTYRIRSRNSRKVPVQTLMQLRSNAVPEV